MLELSHDFNFFDQTLFSIFFAIGDFFREGLDCVLLFILFFSDEVNSREVPLPDFANGLELVVETSLIQFFPQNIPPALHHLPRFKCIHTKLIRPFKFDLKFHKIEAELQVVVEGCGL